jgi:hypothetical protein
LGTVKFKVPLGGHVEDMPGGRPLAPGEEIDLTRKGIEEDDDLRQKVADGRLIGVSDAANKLATELREQPEPDEPSVPPSALDVDKLPGGPEAEGGS